MLLLSQYVSHHDQLREPEASWLIIDSVQAALMFSSLGHLDDAFISPGFPFGWSLELLADSAVCIGVGVDIFSSLSTHKKAPNINSRN